MMRNCEYILDAVYKLRDFEEDPATHRALRAAIIAMIDEHLRHSGEEPWLEFGVIDQIGEDEPPEGCQINSDTNTCRPVPAWVADASNEFSKRVAVEALERLNSPLLKHV